MISSDSVSASRLLAAVLLSFVLAGCAAVPAKRPAGDEAAGASEQALTAGDSAYRRGDFDEALVEYVKAGNAQPDNAATLLRIARCQEALGDLGLAADAYQRALRLRPGSAEASEGLGLILLRQGLQAPAGELLNSAVQGNPQAWRAYNGLGVIADLSGDHTGAEAQYRRANEINPDQPQVLNNLGYSRYLAGDLDQAQTYFRQALARAPGNPKAWSNLGLVYTRQGRYPQAVAAFSEIMSPAEAYYSTGYICMLERQLRDARQLFERAIRLSPTYYVAAYSGLDRVRRETAAQAGTP